MLPLLNSWRTSSAIISRGNQQLYTSNTTCNISMDADIMFNGNMLEMFRPTSEVEVKEIIIESPNNVTW